MVSLTVPYSEAAIALVDVLRHTCHCHCRVLTDPDRASRVVVIEADRALVIPRQMWDEAYCASADPDEEHSDWDEQWLRWPLAIAGHISRFDLYTLAVEED